MSAYGKTWWGKKWLETFNDIDDANRLARGRTYANTGRAHNIEIKGNTVTAKVKGSRPSPYTVTIIFQEFDSNTADNLKGIITNSPLILSQLLNKKLPLQILDSLDKAKIKLFPSSWREINAQCSCPDWAMPCKHIASIIYLLCVRIDNNPFTLFEVHNCYLLDLITDYQDGRLENIQKIVTLEEILTTPTKSDDSISAIKFTKDLDGNDTKTVQNLYNIKLDLSKINHLFNCIITILEDFPPFYNKNFRDILASVYKYWQTHPRGVSGWYNFLSTNNNNGKKKLSEEELFLLKWNNPESLDDIILEVDENYSISIQKNKVNDSISQIKPIKDSESQVSFKNNNRHDIFNQGEKSVFAMVTFLDELPSALLHRFSPKILFLHILYQYAVILLQRSAIIPQILENAQGITFIRWIPALFDSSVKNIYDELVNHCPENLIVYNGHKISSKEQVTTSISWLISGIIYNKFPSNLMNREVSDVFLLFFYGKAKDFTYFQNKETPNSINQWLSKLHLAKRSNKLYLNIDDKEEYFELIPQILLENSDVPISISQALNIDNITTKLEVLSDLSLIADHLPKFDSIIQEGAKVRFTLEDFAPIFLKILPALQAIGVIVVLPKSLHAVLKPKINLALKAKSSLTSNAPSFLSLKNLLEFNWQIAIGNQILSIEEFKKILNQSGNLIKIKDNYILLDEKEIAQLLKQIEKLPDQLSQEDLLQAMLAEEIDDSIVSLDINLQKLMQSLTEHTPLPVPHNLKACLRPYQERGFNWLVQNINFSFGSILADDMGLGKTIQVIAVILYLKNHLLLTKQQRVLIVAPTGLLSNWDKEFKKFAPEISTCIYHGAKRELLEECDVIITSYGLARSDTKELKKMNWLLLVIDEAQNIKNPYSAQTKSIKSIEATHKIAMSGTPVENRLLEYWSIFDFTNKMYLGNLKHFKNRYASPIEKERNEACLNRFKKATAPFILRRLKNDKSIITDLPEKIENNRYCTLTPAQTALYKKVVDNSIEKIESAEGIERKGLVLQLINALKQICNHPAQFIKKRQKLSFEQSGKMIMLEEIVSEIYDIGEKCLIFTQYVEMGNIINELLAKKIGIRIPFLHGKISRASRENMINDFQDPFSSTKFFIISLKAGGTGLNLTAANHVIHYDLWWNPAVENQATDRAYRIGQKRNVMVHRFITNSTFEERIDEMIKSKKELANLTVSHGENWITEMTTTEIKSLVELKNT